MTPTPHIGAAYGEIADRVIMAGDPLRAKFMAERYLESPQLVNEVRGMYCYTGTYKGKRVSVMGHGMGISSIGIYTHELFNFYGVKRIIRTGSAGSYQADLHIGDIVIAQGACDNSNFAAQFGLPGTFAPIADYGMLSAAVDKAKEMGVKYAVGNILASEIFYNDNPEAWKQWQKMGVLAVEMEASALYMNAARSGNAALCICTISDSLVTHEETTAEQREKTFTDMMEIAFEII
ncbi:MAG: purine-nucleoside phosphorylase [Alistipes sp.]|nr:purine-nucleoside phosphorylase [Alistipes sp.]